VRPTCRARSEFNRTKTIASEDVERDNDANLHRVWRPKQILAYGVAKHIGDLDGQPKPQLPPWNQVAQEARQEGTDPKRGTKLPPNRKRYAARVAKCRLHIFFHS